MNASIRLMVGLALLSAAATFAAPNTKGPPSEFPGNGSGPPQGWFPGNGNGLDKGAPDSGSVGGGGFSGADGGSVHLPSVTDVHTVPEPSTLLLSMAALGLLARAASRRR